MADETFWGETIALAIEAVKQVNFVSAERHLKDIMENIDFTNIEISTQAVKTLYELANKSQIIAKRNRYDKMASMCGILSSASFYRKTIFLARQVLQKKPFPHSHDFSEAQLVAVQEISDILEMAEKQIDRIHFFLASAVEREILCEDKRYHNWKLPLSYTNKVICIDWLIAFQDYLLLNVTNSDRDSNDSGIQLSPLTSNSSRKSDNVFTSLAGSETDINKKEVNGLQTSPPLSVIFRDRQNSFQASETNKFGTSSRKSSFHHLDEIKAKQHFMDNSNIESSTTLPDKKLHRSWSAKASYRPTLRNQTLEGISNSCVDISSLKNKLSNCNGLHKENSLSDLRHQESRTKSIDLDRLHENIQLLVRRISADTRRSSIRSRPSEDLLRTSIEAGVQNWCYLRKEDSRSISSKTQRLSWIEKLASEQIDGVKSSFDDDIFLPKMSELALVTSFNKTLKMPLNNDIKRTESSNKTLNKQKWLTMLSATSQRAKNDNLKVIRIFRSTNHKLSKTRDRNIDTKPFEGIVYRERLNFELLSPLATVFSKVTSCIDKSCACLDTVSAASSLLSLQIGNNSDIWYEYVNVLLRVACNLRASAITSIHDALNIHKVMLDILLNRSDNILKNLPLIGDVVADAAMTLFSTRVLSRSLQVMEDAMYLFTYCGQISVSKLAKSWFRIGQMYVDVRSNEFSVLLNKIAHLVRKAIYRWSAKPKKGNSFEASDKQKLFKSSCDLFSVNKDNNSDCEYGDDSDAADDSDDDSDEEEGDYDVSLHEAFSAFLHSETILRHDYETDNESKTTFLLTQGALADCRMITGDCFVAMEQYNFVVNQLETCSPSKELSQLHVHCLLMSSVGCFLRHQLTECLTLLERAEILQQTRTVYEQNEILFASLLSASIYYKLKQVNALYIKTYNIFI